MSRIATQRREVPQTREEDTEERQLIARVQAGDGTALESIFRTHYAPLCGFLRSYVESQAVAEEIVQDLFLRIWERRAQWSVDGSLRGYLYGAARHRALNALRHRRMYERWTGVAEREDRAIGMGNGIGGADANIRTAEFAQVLAQAIADLSPRCREVYIMRVQHEMSHAEIAQALGISRKAVEFQLTRAFKAVAERVDPLVGE